MKKLVAALVVLAMVLAMVPAVFAADEMEITGSVTDKFVGTFTATSDGFLTLNVESVDEGYGYRFDVWNVTKEELVDTIVSNEATVQTIDLTADNVYEITVEYVQYWNPTLYMSASGTVNCTLTYSGTGTLASDGEEEFAADVIIAEGNRGSNDYTWTADKTGTLTVGTSALYSYNSDAGVWEEAAPFNFMMGSVNLVVNGEQYTYTATATLEVTAGDEVTVSLFSFYGNQYAANLTFSVEESTGGEGGETVSSELSIGNNQIEAANVTYVYTAGEDGTLNVALGAAIMGPVEAKVYVSGNDADAQYLYTNSDVDLALKSGETAVVEVTAEGYATLTATWTAGSGDDGSDSEEEFTADVIIAEGNRGSNDYTWTADKTGTLTVGTSALYSYNSDAGVWEEAAPFNFMMGSVNLVVNGEQYTYTATATLEVTAGDEVTVSLFSFYGNQYAANLTFSVEESTGGEGSDEDENLNGAFSGSGTMDDPYVIESLPAEVDFTLTESAYDIYFILPAGLVGTISGEASCDMMYIVDETWVNESSVEVTAENTVLVNVWQSNPSAYGNHSLSLSIETEQQGGEVTPNDCDVVLPGETVTCGKEFLSSNENTKEYYKLSWTAPADGILHVHMCEANPGWAYGIDGLTNQHSGTDAATHTYTVLAGTTYDITVKGYNCAEYCDGDSEVAWMISFETAEVEVPKEEYIIIDDIITEEGTYDIDMEYANVTIVTFAPSVEGIYTITVNGQAVIGNYGGGSHYIYASDSVTHGTSLEWICAEAPEVETDTILDENWQEIEIERINDGQGLMIGIKPDSEDVESVEITIEKTGEYVVEEVELQDYENKAELSQFELGDLVVGDYVDVYGEDHTAVLGEDGYYHLDSADGPILLVDMDYLAVLTDALSGGRGVMYAYVVDENGEITAKYDIADAVKAYEAVCDENGYYPLTEDLMFFYQVYAVGNGVPNYVLEEGFNEQCAWMFACITAEAPASEEGKPGDTALAAVIGLMAVSAMGITVIVSKKKEF